MLYRKFTIELYKILGLTLESKDCSNIALILSLNLRVSVEFLRKYLIKTR